MEVEQLGMEHLIFIVPVVCIVLVTELEVGFRGQDYTSDVTFILILLTKCQDLVIARDTIIQGC